MIVIARLKRPPWLVYHATVRFSWQDGRSALLGSMYHRHGWLSLPTPKSGERIEKTMEMMEARRGQLARKALLDKLPQKGREVEEYLKCYEQLGNEFKGIELRNEWAYRVAGWYNLSATYKPLLSMLLDSEKEETGKLVDVLAMIKHTWSNSYGLIDEDLRQERRIQRFYRDLSLTMTINRLQKIQEIVLAPLVIGKRSFYDNYADQYMSNLLRKDVSAAIWLYQRCTLNMSDQINIADLVQKHLIATKPSLQAASLERLINLYTLKGRVNAQLYKEFLRPYLMRTKMGEASSIIEAIKFVVYSQCEDTQLLKALYQLLETYDPKLLRSRNKYDLHIITHYLRVLGYSIRLPSALENDLIQFCMQRSQGRQSVSKLVTNLNPKTKPKFASNCLSVPHSSLRQFDATATSEFQARFRSQLTQLQLKDMRIYEKPIFCCFQLDFCLHRESSKELYNIQVGGMQYVFSSGRMIRTRELRNKILQHYGFQINHIDCNTFHATRPHPQELLKPRRVFFSRK